MTESTDRPQWTHHVYPCSLGCVVVKPELKIMNRKLKMLSGLAAEKLVRYRRFIILKHGGLCCFVLW